MLTKFLSSLLIAFSLMTLPVFGDSYRRGSGLNEGDLDMQKYSVQFAEVDSTPACPPSDELKIYSRDNGSGTTKLYMLDSSCTQTAIGSGTGTVTSIATSNGITGGTITTTGTISGINALADGSTKGVSAFIANDFDSSTGVISIDYTNGQKATNSIPGFMTAADHTTLSNIVSSQWTTSGSNIYRGTGYVGIGSGTSSSIRGPFDINAPTLSIGNATLNPLVINYGSGSNYTNDGYCFQYTLYAKKTSGADTVYSAVGSTQSACDNSGSGMNYTVTASWSAVSGATGYLIIVNTDDYTGSYGDAYITTASLTTTSDGGDVYTYGDPTYSPSSIGPDFYFNTAGSIVFSNGIFYINGSNGASPGGSTVPVGSIIQPGNVLTMETNTDGYAGVGGGVRLTLVNEDYHNGALFTNKSLDLIDFQFAGPSTGFGGANKFCTIRWEGRNPYMRNSANNSRGEMQIGSTVDVDGIPAFTVGDGAVSLSRGKYVVYDGVNFELKTTTGTKFGTATTQKLAFFNSTPIVQPGATTDLGLLLSNLGLRASGTAYPITTSGSVTLGSLTSTRIPIAGTAGLLGDDADLTFTGGDTLNVTKIAATTFTGNVTLSTKNIVTDSTTGSSFGTATTQKTSAYGVTPVVQGGATTDLGTILSNWGLRAAGTAYPITTSGATNLSGTNTINGYATLAKASQTLSYQPGLLTAVNATIGVYAKVVNASTVDNIIGSAVTFSCIANPTITMYECGTSATCASSPVTIGTVTVTASGQAFAGTVSNSAITAGDYIGWAMTAGTCASIDVAANAQIHSN